MTRPVLTIIQVTHASLEGFEHTGLLDRHRRLLEAYARTFEVVVHSSDRDDYSARLGVTHRPFRWLPRAGGLRHAAFYLGLLFRAPRMTGVLKVIGSNIPTLPLVRRLSGRPMAVTYQYDYAANAAAESGAGSLRARLSALMERLALCAADLVYVTTPRLQAKVRDRYHRPTVLLPNWVPDPPDDAGPPRDRETGLIVYAGRLHRAKGLDGLMQAFHAARVGHPGARLEILGSGEERERLEALAAQLNPGSVSFRGTVPHDTVLERLEACAIFVLATTTMEGQPKALLEAMARGAACVVTDVPGNRDLVVDGISGLLVPPGDSAALARALERLLGDPALRARLGHAARLQLRSASFSEVVARDIRILLDLAECAR